MSTVHIDTGLDPESEPALASSAGDPFRIVLLGDFGGRASRNEPRLRRDPILIDPDNFEEVMERLGTGLELSAGDVPHSMQFRELDDFHPDHLYETLPVFQSLRRARKELADPATFRAAAASLRTDAPLPPAAPFSGSLLDQIVEQTSETAPSPLDHAASLDDTIRRIVAPHLISKPDPRQDEFLAQVDAATGALMRAILSHPRYQALEAAWRSVFFLLQRLETGVELKLYLIDITREEMLEATSSGHPQLIAREGWSAAACLHSFSPTEQDCAALGSLAGLARKSGGPLLAGIDPRLMGCESLAATPDPDDWRHPLDELSRQAWRPSRCLLDRPGHAAHSAAPSLWARHLGGRVLRFRRDAAAARPRGVSLGQSGHRLRLPAGSSLQRPRLAASSRTAKPARRAARAQLPCGRRAPHDPAGRDLADGSRDGKNPGARCDAAGVVKEHGLYPAGTVAIHRRPRTRAGRRLGLARLAEPPYTEPHERWFEGGACFVSKIARKPLIFPGGARRQRKPLIPHGLRVAIFIISGGPPRGVLVGLPWPGQ
jgi:predicted component of type VI protein secretion system